MLYTHAHLGGRVKVKGREVWGQFEVDMTPRSDRERHGGDERSKYIIKVLNKCAFFSFHL